MSLSSYQFGHPVISPIICTMVPVSAVMSTIVNPLYFADFIIAGSFSTTLDISVRLVSGSNPLSYLRVAIPYNSE